MCCVRVRGHVRMRMRMRASVLVDRGLLSGGNVDGTMSRAHTHTRTRITGTDTHTRTLMRMRLRMCLREEGEREGWYTYIHVRACAHMQKSSALMTLFSLVPSSAEQMFTLTDALGRQLQVIDSPLLRLGVPQQ